MDCDRGKGRYSKRSNYKEKKQVSVIADSDTTVQQQDNWTNEKLLNNQMTTLGKHRDKGKWS